MHVAITRGIKRFGVVAMGNEIPSWAWFVGSQGTCMWTMGGTATPMEWSSVPSIATLDVHKDRDPLYQDVDVILVQGKGHPPLGHPLWNLPSVQIVIWTMANSRGGRRNAPEGWRCFTRVFFHAKLGGVSDGRFAIGYAVRQDNREVTWVSRGELFPNFLKQIWRPTESGREVGIPSSDTPTENTTRGLLAWKTRETCYVSGPTVFTQRKWVSRRLTRRELADACDMPADKYKQGSEFWRIKLATQQVPGKVLAQAVSSIAWNDEVKDSKEDGRRLHVKGHKTPTPRWANEDLTGPTAESEVGKKVSLRDANPREPNFADGCAREDRPRKRVRFTGVDIPSEGEESGHGKTTGTDEKWQIMFGETSVGQGTVSDKAVKADSAGVPCELWDRRLLEGTRLGLYLREYPGYLHRALRALEVIRDAALRWWKRRVTKSFVHWYANTTHESSADAAVILEAGRKALWYVGHCSWWEWLQGSGILFWRWPTTYQTEIRLGVAPMFIGPPPSAMDRQPPYTCAETRKQVLDKVGTVIGRGYIERVANVAEVHSLMYMFHVPKGLDDVRMVYDGSKSGLNKVLYAPWFYIHSVDMMCRSLLPGYWCADNDYGEQFLNFNLHPTLQKVCGVDLTQLLSPGKIAGTPRRGGDEIMGKWTRCAMGLRPSPYVAVKGALIARRLILGDRKDTTNPFAWDRIRLNQPGDVDYRPDLPWIMLLRKDGALASSVCQYIDDLRTCAKDETTAWEASSRIAKTLGWLGLQDAARKRRAPSQSPGAWSGATVITKEDNVFQSVTPERWLKTQTHIRWLASCIGKTDGVSAKVLSAEELEAAASRTERSPIDHKRLESCRGFLVYVSNTYRAMIPYLKGIHLTVDSWRPDRDDDGWRLPYKLRRLMSAEGNASGLGDNNGPPKAVVAATRLEKDLEALMDFTRGDTGPLVPVRSKKTVSIYMVGDASGTGFGGSIWRPGARSIDATFGAWETSVSETESSNFREALNLVMMIERQVASGELERGSELFVFTDNSTAERAFNKGASSVKKLHELVVRIRKLEMLGLVVPRFVWISGERMIAQGTDGLSRGDLNCGVMGDGAFLKHIPLNRTAFSYDGTLKEECLTWVPSPVEWRFLTEEDWFDGAFSDARGKYVWTPSAALARVAVEQLCEVKHIHPYTTHVFVAPALMTSAWRKLLGKQSDALLTLPAGTECWPNHCFEPLVLSLTCPLMSHSPWIVRNTEWISNWTQEMRGVWKIDSLARRNCMRKFWAHAHEGPSSV